VVDDSTEETIDILREYERQYYPKIRVIHRDTRAGYKAGALNEALKNSKGEFILVLDADSILKPDFLKKTIPLFLTNEKLGFIQGKLECLNEEESWLSEALASVNYWFAHILQSSFSVYNMIMGFTGHGGIIRRRALEDIGGWMSDTIAEDLDFAYRLQLKGWRALYVEAAVSYEETPPNYYSAVVRFKRHLKGPLQNLIKHGRSIIKHRNLNSLTKIEALMQLAYSLVYPLGLICLALVLIAYTIIPGEIVDGFWHSAAGFLCSTLLLISFPSISLMISPIPSLIIILLALAFVLTLFPKYAEFLGKMKIANSAVIFGLLLIWYDNMINCLSPIAEILLGRKGEWIPTERSLKKRAISNRAKRMMEAILRIAASLLVAFFFMNILPRNFSLNSLGILFPIAMWLYSACLIIRD
ncbi:MAG: glycosyltransferase family 2 protein, partial [Thermoproteota archaeon]